jgi:hypothetical protein
VAELERPRPGLRRGVAPVRDRARRRHARAPVPRGDRWSRRAHGHRGGRVLRRQPGHRVVWRAADVPAGGGADQRRHRRRGGDHRHRPQPTHPHRGARRGRRWWPRGHLGPALGADRRWTTAHPVGLAGRRRPHPTAPHRARRSARGQRPGVHRPRPDRAARRRRLARSRRRHAPHRALGHRPLRPVRRRGATSRSRCTRSGRASSACPRHR